MWISFYFVCSIIWRWDNPMLSAWGFLPEREHVAGACRIFFGIGRPSIILVYTALRRIGSGTFYRYRAVVNILMMYCIEYHRTWNAGNAGAHIYYYIYINIAHIARSWFRINEHKFNAKCRLLWNLILSQIRKKKSNIFFIYIQMTTVSTIEERKKEIMIKWSEVKSNRW